MGDDLRVDIRFEEMDGVRKALKVKEGMRNTSGAGE
jgi:hypothetical protein